MLQLLGPSRMEGNGPQRGGGFRLFEVLQLPVIATNFSASCLEVTGLNIPHLTSTHPGNNPDIGILYKGGIGGPEPKELRDGHKAKSRWLLLSPCHASTMALTLLSQVQHLFVWLFH